MSYTIHHGDMLSVLDFLPADSIEALVSDPPYHLQIGNHVGPKVGKDAYARMNTGFMGCTWDGGDLAFRPETWAKVLRVMKPGAFGAVFGGSRTFHRLAVALEDAGFELRDTIMWITSSGFPKSKNISLAIDKGEGCPNRGRAIPTASAYRNFDQVGGEKLRRNPVPDYEPTTELAQQWKGWGSSLKTAYEPILLIRKPLIGTLAANVIAHGVGGLNIDACRVGDEIISTHHAPKGTFAGGEAGRGSDTSTYQTHTGRCPANFLQDGCLDHEPFSRYFYSGKANRADRAGSKHPTVKPVSLMRYLSRLICPRGGTILDPFAGSGTTGEAAWREDFNVILIEREDQFVDDIRRRMTALESEMTLP